MNKFLKVPFEQYYIFRKGIVDRVTAMQECNALKAPCRATSGSCGYDLFAPFSFTMKPKSSILIPTGYAIQMDEDKCFLIFPRSGLGMNYGAQLANTVGIIDSDYIGSVYYGHMLIKLVNTGAKKMEVEAGKGIAQGIILPYFKTDNDVCDGVRTGGFGSTDVTA